MIQEFKPLQALAAEPSQFQQMVSIPATYYSRTNNLREFKKLKSSTRENLSFLMRYTSDQGDFSRIPILKNTVVIKWL